MSATETRQAIESILMVADNPVEPSVLAQLLEVPKADVEAMCDELAAEYEAAGRGFILARVAGGYRFQSHPDLAPYVERFVLDGQTSRLSSAALETLAIVAYKQPISRMQVAAIRGVNVDGVLRTLQQRGYVDEISRDTGPGNAVLFGTTDLFLERVGLDSTADLPPLAEFVPGADVVEALEDGLRPDPVDTSTPPSEPPTETDAADPGVEADTSDPEPAPTPTIDDVDAVDADDAAEAEGAPSEPALAGPDSSAVDLDTDADLAVADADEAVDADDADVAVADADEAVADADVAVADADEAVAAENVDVGLAEADEALADEADESGVVAADAARPPELDEVPESVDEAVPAEGPVAAEDAALVDLAGFEEVDAVIDLVAEETPDNQEPDEVIERPTELEEELAAIDALAADVADADAGEAPTWSPAESSTVTTVRHDDPPEAEPAAPFRPAPGGLGGAGTEAGPGGQDLATGEDLGSGEAPPLTGPDAGDD